MSGYWQIHQNLHLKLDGNVSGVGLDGRWLTMNIDSSALGWCSLVARNGGTTMTEKWRRVQDSTDRVNGIEQQEGTKYFRVDDSCVIFHRFLVSTKSSTSAWG